MSIDLFAVIPIVILLITLLGFKLPAKRAAACSFLSALLISLSLFGLSTEGLAIAFGKGLSLSLFVLLIIWAAVFFI